MFTVPYLINTDLTACKPTTNTYPLSIFPESEQRRIAADFTLLQGGGRVDQLRVPVAVKWAIALVAAWGG